MSIDGPIAKNYSKRGKLRALLCATAALGLVPAAGLSAAPALASPAKITIAFAQGYCGNTWRATMDNAFFAEAKQLENAGVLASYKYVCADNSVPTQESQMADFILEHPSVIVLDPTSSTALNGEIAKSVAAHIPVLVTDSGPVTSPLAYELNAPNAQLMLHGKGNVLVVRGIAGNLAEQQFYNATVSVYKKYPGIHIVGTVWGQWTDAISEQAVAKVLSGLPSIQGVSQQGGSYGVAEAFKAAGRPIPIIVGDNRGTFLHWWTAEHKLNGYTTLSAATNPGIGGADVYVAVQMAEGKVVPKNMLMPILTITQAQLPAYANLSLTASAAKTYPDSWYQTNIIGRG
jgi:ribose transport system substrate-binding protein